MATFKGSRRDDDYRGTRSADRIEGRGGDDRLHGGSGDDTILGGNGDDWLAGGRGNDALSGGKGFDVASFADLGASVLVDLAKGTADDSFGERDTLRSIEGVEGGVLNDSLSGDAGANWLSGGGGNDFLYGRDGDDRITGGDGNDFIFGGRGADVLSGGAANDIFAAGDIGTTPETADRITDFGYGADLIDLSGLDADVTKGGDQAFTFIGTRAFSGDAGELRYQVVGNTTWLAADVDGDKVADGYLALDGIHQVLPGDLIL
jgi:Ca2+-binding RTX toxin-like protein